MQISTKTGVVHAMLSSFDVPENTRSKRAEQQYREISWREGSQRISRSCRSYCGKSSVRPGERPTTRQALAADAPRAFHRRCWSAVGARDSQMSESDALAMLAMKTQQVAERDHGGAAPGRQQPLN